MPGLEHAILGCRSGSFCCLDETCLAVQRSTYRLPLTCFTSLWAGITCKVYGSNEDCAGDGHVFHSIVKNSQKEGLPTLWRSFRCQKDFDAADGEGGKMGADAIDEDSTTDVDGSLPGNHREGIFSGREQPGSAGWSYNAASMTAPTCVLKIVTIIAAAFIARAAIL